jgi:hypothetical protein
MPSLLDRLKEKETWEEFRQYRKDHSQLTRRELRELDQFMAEERYMSFSGLSSYGIPEKKLISKSGSSRKRTVYSFGAEATWMLKLLSYLLYSYDSSIHPSCYSFRRYVKSSDALRDVMLVPGLDERYILKADIHDYFGSIDGRLLRTMLREIINDDERLLDFLTELLDMDRCIYDGEEIREDMGAMAGVPVSGFFADIYLRSMDTWFSLAGIPYFRYSDDLLVLAKDASKREDAMRMVRTFADMLGLTLNPDKTRTFEPGEGFEFLGFSYRNGTIDLSDVTIKKMKGKIRRKTRKVMRRMKRTGASPEKAAASMIRSFDNKFYDLTGTNSFSWIRFYFPVINTTNGLSEIDRYMTDCLRYLFTGRHSLKNRSIPYDKLRKLGYTPLKAEYYRWRKENALLNAGERGFN